MMNLAYCSDVSSRDLVGNFGLNVACSRGITLPKNGKNLIRQHKNTATRFLMEPAFPQKASNVPTTSGPPAKLFLYLPQRQISLRTQKGMFCFEMGLPQFPSYAYELIPGLILTTLLSVHVLKDLVRDALLYIGFELNDPGINNEILMARHHAMSMQEDKVTSTKFNTWHKNRTRRGRSGATGGQIEEQDVSAALKRSVCLCKFKDSDEASEVKACQHLFHKACLEKWFRKHMHSSCPFCRAIV